MSMAKGGSVLSNSPILSVCPQLVVPQLSLQMGPNNLSAPSMCLLVQVMLEKNNHTNWSCDNTGNNIKSNIAPLRIRFNPFMRADPNLNSPLSSKRLDNWRLRLDDLVVMIRYDLCAHFLFFFFTFFSLFFDPYPSKIL